MVRGDETRKARRSPQTDATPTRDRLIQAATDAFARSGYQGARVDNIAKRAGINKQLVYHYFGSKDALYAAVLENAYLKFRGDDRMIRASIDEPDPELALKKLATYLFSRTASNDTFQRLIQDLNVQSNRRHLKSLTGVQQAYSRLIQAVTDILDRGVKCGRFRSGIDPREFYVSLAGVYSVRISNAATLSHVLGVDLNSKDGARRSQEAAFDLLLRGICINADMRSTPVDGDDAK